MCAPARCYKTRRTCCDKLHAFMMCEEAEVSMRAVGGKLGRLGCTMNISPVVPWRELSTSTSLVGFLGSLKSLPIKRFLCFFSCSLPWLVYSPMFKTRETAHKRADEVTGGSKMKKTDSRCPRSIVSRQFNRTHEDLSLT